MKAPVCRVNKRQLIVNKQHTSQGSRHKDQDTRTEKISNVKAQIGSIENPSCN